MEELLCFAFVWFIWLGGVVKAWKLNISLWRAWLWPFTLGGYLVGLIHGDDEQRRTLGLPY
jgi:formate-dependent nitrite reductase membrane component NrfD